jgi:quercetin dioxygenase-like cupin family protein
VTLSPSFRERLVRYDELRPCTNAFIDARSPGSDKKENFTIIGPGVAENPQQYVHIRTPHGFNIGAARQPPGCTNSLHSHDSAEVFVVYRGTWRFFWGEHGDAGEILLGPGDTISIPIHVFRGFENVGGEIGFMFAVLGGDDPGRVHWAPHVIEKAQGHGLVLLENGSLIDTTIGESLPDNISRVLPSSREEIAYIRTPTLAEMVKQVARRDQLRVDTGSLPTSEHMQESAVILTSHDGQSTAAAIAAPHDFTVHRLTLDAGATTPCYRHDGAEVLLVIEGSLVWRNSMTHATESTPLNSGDTFSVPPNTSRCLEALTDAVVFIVRGGVPAGAPPAPLKIVPSVQ